MDFDEWFETQNMWAETLEAHWHMLVSLRSAFEAGERKGKLDALKPEQDEVK